MPPREVGRKEPRPSNALGYNADDIERPNLAEYFDDFPVDIQDVDRIKICRAYAAYLSSQLPPKPKKIVKKN